VHLLQHASVDVPACHPAAVSRGLPRGFGRGLWVIPRPDLLVQAVDERRRRAGAGEVGVEDAAEAVLASAALDGRGENIYFYYRMVEYQDDALDHVFSAVADPTRDPGSPRQRRLARSAPLYARQLALNGGVDNTA